MAYPGESVVIDHNLSPQSIHPLLPPTSNGAFINLQDWPCNDAYVQGIEFRDMRNMSFRLGSNRVVFFENRFFNLGPGRDGANSAFIMFSGRELNTSFHMFVRDNVFNQLNTGAFVKTYGWTYSVIENNVFTNPSGDPLEGLALKHANRHVDVRYNYFDGDFGDGAINGNWNDDGDIEIRYNLILNSPVLFPSNNFALNINHDGNANNPYYIYRNTIQGTVFLNQAHAGNGPFYFNNNVVINENSGTPSGSHVSYSTDSRRLTDVGVFRYGANFARFVSDNAIDSQGNLSPAFSSQVGTHGYQLGNIGTHLNRPGRSPPPMPPVNLRVE